MSENIWVMKLDSRFRCLFPQMALLSNSCLSNCRCLHRDSGAIRGLEIRAQVPIKAGTELSIQYNTLVLGHRKRRQLFRQGQSKEHTCWETPLGKRPCTMLQKFSKCEVKAALCGNFTILLPHKLYVKSNF